MGAAKVRIKLRAKYREKLDFETYLQRQYWEHKRTYPLELMEQDCSNCKGEGCESCNSSGRVAMRWGKVA